MIINSINESADRKFFNKWLRDNYTIDAIIYSDIEVNIVFNDEPLQAIQDIIINKYNSLTINDITNHLIDAAYDQRERDGSEFYKEQRANLYKQIISGSISVEDAFYIEGKLSLVIPLLEKGEFWSCQYFINLVTIEGAYTQEIHDLYKGFIDTYVTANY